MGIWANLASISIELRRTALDMKASERRVAWKAAVGDEPSVAISDVSVSATAIALIAIDLRVEGAIHQVGNVHIAILFAID